MSTRGFTLIELVVTLGIMVMITSVTLANHSKFGGKILLRTTAYEMALAIREAQTYGISVRKAKASDIGDFQYAYGLHFDASTPTEYILFADTKGNRDGLRGNSLEDQAKYTIGKGYKINKLCVNSNNTCVNVSTSSVGSLDITFNRPEPDAAIRFNGEPNNIYSDATIELISPKGDTINVLVEVSGQISVVK